MFLLSIKTSSFTEDVKAIGMCVNLTRNHQYPHISVIGKLVVEQIRYVGFEEKCDYEVVMQRQGNLITRQIPFIQT